MNPIDYARGRGIRDARPKARTVYSVAEFVEALDADRCAEKSRSPYICGPMAGGQRAADNALPRAWLPLDADRINPSALGKWRERWSKLSAVRWATHSSSPDAPRERVVVFLEKPASRAECIALGAELTADVRAEFGDDVELDPSVFRPEQPILVPPLGSAIEVFAGAALPVIHRGGGAKPESAGPCASTSSVILCHPLSLSVGVASLSVGVASLSVGGFALGADGAFPPDCAPTGSGQRNAKLFNLARRLKRENPGAAYPAVRKVAIRWHERFVGVIATKEPAATIETLWSAYGKIKAPPGGGMSTILEVAKGIKLPPQICAMGYSERGLHLARVCVAMAEHHGREPFFLSARKAGEVAGIHFADAAQVLRVMTLDGALEVVRRGSGRMATRYRLGPLLTQTST